MQVLEMFKETWKGFLHAASMHCHSSCILCTVHWKVEMDAGIKRCTCQKSSTWLLLMIFDYMKFYHVDKWIDGEENLWWFGQEFSHTVVRLPNDQLLKWLARVVPFALLYVWIILASSFTIFWCFCAIVVMSYAMCDWAMEYGTPIIYLGEAVGSCKIRLLHLDCLWEDEGKKLGLGRRKERKLLSNMFLFCLFRTIKFWVFSIMCFLFSCPMLLRTWKIEDFSITTLNL